MVFYDISILDKNRLFEWISQQPNQIAPPQNASKKILCEFNHTPAQELEFKKGLVSQLITIDNSSVMDSLFKYMEQLLSDQLIYSSAKSVTKTNIGTAFVDVFSATYGGEPFGIDTTGFSKFGIVLNWNKNGGSGVHTVRLIDNADPTKVFVSGDMVTGRNRNYNINISTEFRNFRGELRLQAKSTVAADDPILDGIWVYLIR